MRTKNPRAVVCGDCEGSGQRTGTAGANGLALTADCPTCGGSGRR